MYQIYLKIRKILPIKIAVERIIPDLSKTFAFTTTSESHGVYINKSAVKNCNIDYNVIRNEI